MDVTPLNRTSNVVGVSCSLPGHSSRVFQRWTWRISTDKAESSRVPRLHVIYQAITVEQLSSTYRRVFKSDSYSERNKVQSCISGSLPRLFIQRNNVNTLETGVAKTGGHVLEPMTGDQSLHFPKHLHVVILYTPSRTSVRNGD
jgi:hypothetical protein